MKNLALLGLVGSLFALVAGGPSDAKAEGPGPQTYILIAAQEQLPEGLANEVEAIGGSIAYALPEIGIAIATSAEADFAADAASIAGLRSVVPDVAFAFEESAESTLIGNPPTSGDDDGFFDMQWALDAIDAPEAWATGARGAGVRVAVLDTGVDVDHPDLAPNLNLALSTSFVPGAPLHVPFGPPSFTASAHHGSWVAGIIAAADNGIGTIGVAPEADLVAIRVGTNSGSLVLSAALSGIVYASNVDADVLNMSFATLLPRRGFTDANGDDVSASEVAELSVAYTRALAFAHRQGATLVASAGNQTRDLDADQDTLRLPTQSPHVIAVAATGPRGWGADPSTDLDLPACYSNYGRSVVDLAAPGGNRDCAVPLPPPPPLSLCTVVITFPCWGFDLVVGPTINGWSGNFGTSAAAPHVAGVAALVIGANGGQMHPDAVEAILRASADDLGAPGFDPRYGHGRVNAARAVGAS